MLSLRDISVSSTIDSPIILQKAITLAARLQVPFSPSLAQRTTEHILTYTHNGLQLLHLPCGSQKPLCLLFVDFVHGKNGFRLARNRSSKQPLARAAGIKSGQRPTIFDATAGNGADGFVLASLGSRVTMCERSPIIGALLEDGLDRAKAAPETSTIVTGQITLHLEDSMIFLRDTSINFDTIYLDPMYPERQKSALNKQSLRIIRSLVGGDTDSAALLELALVKAGDRVVVKRPLKAPSLSGPKPSHVITMKNSRFDVYLTNLT